MAEFVLEVPVIGNRWAVGLAFQLHLVMVAAIMGAAVIAPAAEIVGWRRADPRCDRLAHGISRVTVRFFAFAATWAVVGIVLLVGLYPTLVGVLVGIFFWPLVVVAATWVAMTFTAYYYYYTWDRLRERRRLHNAIGWGFAASALLFISLITMLSSFQLTPTQATPLSAAILNPTWLPEVFHRHVGNLSYAGLVIAGVAGVCYLSTHSWEDKVFYDWLGHVGLLVGLGFLLLQPIGGWVYAWQIERGAPTAFARIMVGEASWLFILQSFLLAGVFVVGSFYLWQAAAGRGTLDDDSARWMKRATWLGLALGALLVIPKELPLGAMTPWKYLALAGLVATSGHNLYRYLRASSTFVWGRAGSASHLALAAVAVLAVAVLVVMGVIRSTARGDDLIYERLPREQAQRYFLEE